MVVRKSNTIFSRLEFPCSKTILWQTLIEQLNVSSSKQIRLSRRIAVSVEGSKSIFSAEKPMLAQRKK